MVSSNFYILHLFVDQCSPAPPGIGLHTLYRIYTSQVTTWPAVARKFQPGVMSGKVGTYTTLTHQEPVVVVFASGAQPYLLLLKLIMVYGYILYVLLAPSFDSLYMHLFLSFLSLCFFLLPMFCWDVFLSLVLACRMLYVMFHGQLLYIMYTLSRYLIVCMYILTVPECDL